MIIQFASTKRVEVPLQQAEGIGNVDFPQLGGGTRWVRAIKKAIATLEAAKSDNNASLIVLITDGKNANDAPDCAPCP
jgi:Mg-chelatase subunit ChlD